MVALRESQVRRVIWDLRVFQDFKVRKVFLASRELKEIKETKASLDLKVSRVSLAPQALTISSKGSQGFRALRVLLV